MKLTILFVLSLIAGCLPEPEVKTDPVNAPVQQIAQPLQSRPRMVACECADSKCCTPDCFKHGCQCGLKPGQPHPTTP